MECSISWTGAAGGVSPMSFLAETGSGHSLTLDGAPNEAQPEIGGRNLGPRPMELVLVGTGTCSAYDVMMILKRGRHDVRTCNARLTAERADTEPRVFTRIHIHYTLAGAGLSEAAVARAIQLSRDKYCSAVGMMIKTAEIQTSFEIHEAP